MWRFLRRLAAANIRVPPLIIDQEQKEYGGRENSGLAAKIAVPSTTVVKYHVFPGIARVSVEAGSPLGWERAFC